MGLNREETKGSIVPAPELESRSGKKKENAGLTKPGWGGVELVTSKPIGVETELPARLQSG